MKYAISYKAIETATVMCPLAEAAILGEPMVTRPPAAAPVPGALRRGSGGEAPKGGTTGE